MKCLAAGLLLTLAVFLSNAAQADPPTATFYPFNGAASVTLVSGTTLTLNRLGSVSSCNLTLGGTAGYTANLILSDSGIHAGDVYLVAVSYPAISSTSPVLNIYDSGTAGTLLISSTATLTAGSTTLEFVNVTGSSWVHFPKGAVLTKNLGAGVQSALQSGTFPAAAVSVTAFSLAGAINGTQVTGTVPASSTSGTAGAVSAVLSNYPLSNPLVSSSMTWTVMNTQQWTCPVNPNTMLETWDAANNQPLPYNVGTTVVNGEIETPPGAGQVFYGLGTHFLSPYFVFGETVRRMSGNGSGDQTEIELFDGINSYGFTYINNTKSIIGHIKNLSDYFYTPNGVQLTGTQNSAPGNFGYPIDLSSGNFQFAEAGGDGLLWAVVRTPRIPWTPVAVLDPSSFVDLKNPANLALMTPRYYNYNSGGTGAGMIAETNLFAGYTAGFNVCNLSELKYGDGSPLVKAGIHYELGNFVTLSSTAAKDVPSSSAAVFAWDERTHLLACTGVINTNRSGELYGENSGAWIFDPATNLFKCFIPNWGDGNSLGAPCKESMSMTARSLC